MSMEIAAIHIPVSPGELLDRLAIAMVRCAQLHEGPEHQMAKARLETLESIRACHLDDNAKTTSLFKALLATNQRLWQLEDKVRQMRESSEHQPEFITSALEIFSVNDRRSELKRQIDREFGVSGEKKVFRASPSTEVNSHG